MLACNNCFVDMDAGIVERADDKDKIKIRMQVTNLIIHIEIKMNMNQHVSGITDIFEEKSRCYDRIV